jgi:hypothetical protein
MKVLMHALAASCEELRARTGNPPLSSVNISLQNIEESLERFISYDRKHSATILSVLRDVFNHNKKDEEICGRKIEGCPFESLQLDGLDPTNFDNETIWQQIQLQNESLLPKIQTGFKHLLRKADSVQLNDMKNTNNGKYQDNFTEIMNRIDMCKDQLNLILMWEVRLKILLSKIITMVMSYQKQLKILD